MAAAVWFSLPLDDTTVVAVTKKRMRSMRLRVRPNGTVACSVPLGTTKRAATDFITSHTAWIQAAVAKCIARAPEEKTLRTDSAAALAGFSDSALKNGYSATWKRAARANFTATATRCMPYFVDRSIPPYTLKGRAMTSLWGSCNRRTNTITLNWALFSAPQSCIDYVVLHELTHFLYLHHDRAFYGFISQHMPDYKARVSILRSLPLVQQH